MHQNHIRTSGKSCGFGASNSGVYDHRLRVRAKGSGCSECLLLSRCYGCGVGFLECEFSLPHRCHKLPQVVMLLENVWCEGSDFAELCGVLLRRDVSPMS